jgi:hypothetical protein
MKRCGSTLDEQQMAKKTKNILKDLQNTFEAYELKYGERSHVKYDGQTLLL